jgi:hypothetical protein
LIQHRGDNDNNAIGGRDICVRRLKATIKKRQEQTIEDMIMTVTGNGDNVGGEGRDNDVDCGSTSVNNKQQST